MPTNNPNGKSDSADRGRARENESQRLKQRFTGRIGPPAPGLTGLFTLVLTTTESVSAQTAGGCGDLPEQFAALRDLLLQIQSLATAIAVLLAVLMLTYAGALLIRGTPQSVEKAKRIIVYTIGGLVLVFIAGGMVEWVASILCQSGGV